MMSDTDDVATGEDLARFLDGTGNPFMMLLLQLIATAEPLHRARVRVAFPRETIAWEIWSALEDVPSAGDLRALIAMVWPPDPMLGVPVVDTVAEMVRDYKAGRVTLAGRVTS